MAGRDLSRSGMYMRSHDVRLLIDLLDDRVYDLTAKLDSAQRESREMADSLNDTLAVCNDYYKKLRELRDLCAQHHSAVAVADVMAVIGTDDKEDK